MKKIFLCILLLSQVHLFAMQLIVTNSSNGLGIPNYSYDVKTYIGFSKAGFTCGEGWALPFDIPAGGAIALDGSTVWTSPWNGNQTCLGTAAFGDCSSDLIWHNLRVESLLEVGSPGLSYYAGPINLINNNCIDTNNYASYPAFQIGTVTVGTTASYHHGYLGMAEKFKITYNIWPFFALLNFE